MSTPIKASKIATAAIKIPYRINRGPTDVLKALSGTVKHSTQNLPPEIIDDPFFVPQRSQLHKLFRLSKNSGRQTARYIFDNHPALFYRDHAEPKIDAYTTPERFSPKMKFTEQDLLNCVERLDVPNCCVAYEKMCEENIDISNETLLKVMQMICFSNQNEIPDILSCEKTYFFGEKDDERFVWKENMMAKKIFTKLDEAKYKLPSTYSAMIAGLAKHNRATVALSLLNRYRSLNLNEPLYSDAYALLLKFADIDKKVQSRQLETLVDDILVEYEKFNIKPSLQLFNSILQFFSRNAQESNDYVEESFRIVNLMRSLDVSPSLATYTHLVMAVCNQEANPEKFVSAIIADVKNNSSLWAVRDERDFRFLTTIMSIIVHELKSLKLAHQLHQLHDLMPSLYKSQNAKSRYFSDYFKLTLATDSLENIMKFYYDHTKYNFSLSTRDYDMLGMVLDSFEADEETIDKIVHDIIGLRYVGKLSNDDAYRKNEKYNLALNNGGILPREDDRRRRVNNI